MNLKAVTIILFIALIGAIIYIIVLRNQIPDGDAATRLSFAPELFLDEDLYKAFEDIKAHDRDTTGAFIDDKTAAEIFRDYHRWKPMPHGNGNGQPHAFSIGINLMGAMLKRINNINDSLTSRGDTNTIEAIRIHLARKQRSGRPHLDVLLMPALKDKRSYVRLDTANIMKRLGRDDSTMLNTSAPCPTLCQ